METSLPDGPWRSVHETQRITRLGEGLASSGRLGEAAMGRAIRTVEEFCRQAEACGAPEVLIVATSAVREAANRQEFADRLRRATGRDLKVVPGEEEARLALLGALHGLPAPTGAFILFDIGGGSTEFILARRRELVAAASLRLGVVPLAERFMTDGPVEAEHYRAMEREIRERLDAGLAGFPAAPRPQHLIGTAGTVTSLAALDQELAAYDPQRVHGYVLRRERMDQLLLRLAAMPTAARAALPGLEPGRADLIIPGTAICLAVMDRFAVPSVRVSEFGLREGILIQRLAAAP